MWIINDFPVYEIVSGRSTHEKLDFSYCMEKNRAYTLMNDDIFFLLLSKVLSKSSLIQKQKKNRNDFLKGKAKREVASSILSSEEFYDVVSQYEDIVFDFLFCK
jgi:hypothetical protein